MYKLLMGLLVGLMAITQAEAQSIPRSVRATAGGTLSGSGNQITFTIGETVIPSLAAGGNMLTQGFQQPGEQLSTGTLSGNSFCAGSSISIPFSAMDIGTGNTFTAQLSDALGGFASPVTIGTLTGNAGGQIMVTLPALSVSGNGYRIRVVSSVPGLIGSVTPSPFSITSLSTWYLDADGDGFGSPGTDSMNCAQPIGYVAGNGDCNDGNAAVKPGAIEVCNGLDDNCNGLVDDGIFVIPAPAAIGGPEGVCRLSANQVFSVAPVPGATSYEWILPAGATGISTTNTISLNFSSSYITGNLCVKAKNACGVSAVFCRSVKYFSEKPARPLAISGKTVGTCTMETYTIAPVANATEYTWTVPANTTIVSGQGTTSVVVSFAPAFTSGSLGVTASNCMGTSTARTLALARNPARPASIAGPANEVCGGSTQNYSIAAVTGANSYWWTVPSGVMINSGQGTTSISVTFPSDFLSGKITVAAYTSCSNSAARSLTVRSKPALPAAITGPATVCPQAAGLQFSTKAVAGVTYNWVVPSGAIITSGQGTAAITVTWGTVAGNVKVSAANICGSSAERTRSVSLLTCTPTITMAKAEEAEPATGEDNLLVSVWPNPARDVLMVTLDKFLPNQKLELTLMQSDGKVQQAQSLLPSIKGQQVRMDVSRAAGGYYFLVVRQSGKVINRQVVILR